MKSAVFGACTALVWAVATACTSPIGPVGAVTVSTAVAISPANGAFITNSAQPVTLTVRNAFVSDPSVAVRYAFEVAADSAFAAVVQTRDVAQAPDSTSAKLDSLPSNSDYYWRVRTVAGDLRSDYTTALKFTIGPAAGPPLPQRTSAEVR